MNIEEAVANIKRELLNTTDKLATDMHNTVQTAYVHGLRYAVEQLNEVECLDPPECDGMIYGLRWLEAVPDSPSTIGPCLLLQYQDSDGGWHDVSRRGRELPMLVPIAEEAAPQEPEVKFTPAMAELESILELAHEILSTPRSKHPAMLEKLRCQDLIIHTMVLDVLAREDTPDNRINATEAKPGVWYDVEKYGKVLCATPFNAAYLTGFVYREPSGGACGKSRMIFLYEQMISESAVQSW